MPKDQVAETFKKVFPYILIGVGIGFLSPSVLRALSL